MLRAETARLDVAPVAPLDIKARTAWGDHVSENANWYVVQCQSRQEERAIAHLRRQGFVTFCPRVRTMVSHAGRRTALLRALFPGYVFVQLDPERSRWRNVNWTRGVIRIFGHRDAPERVPRGIVEGLLERVRPDQTIDWTIDLKVGQTATLLEGPFAGFVCKLERRDPPGRVHLLLEFLGRSVSAGIRPDALAPAA